MKRLFKKLYLFAGAALILTLLASGITGCKSQPAALTIVNGTVTKTFTMSQIEALTPISGSTGDITSSGGIEGPYNYKGAALSDILKTVGGITANDAVKFLAKDGYSMTMSYNQITNGTEFPTYNTTTGAEVTPDNNITVFLAYDMNGKSLGDDVGPLRLGIMAPNQLTEGEWWVKWVEKIQVVPLQQTWNLNLQGVITASIDQSTFEAGAAPGCHGQSWTDAQGHVWTGIPLWYLAGYVDDTTAMTMNNALWAQGFQVQVVSSGGSKIEYNSADILNNNNIIVAYEEDGQPLSSTQFPLALVGSGVDSQHQISMISSINLILPSTSTTTTP
jgi:hypothetical protein